MSDKQGITALQKWVPLLSMVAWVFIAGSFFVGDTQKITWGTLASISFAMSGTYLIGYSRRPAESSSHQKKGGEQT